MWRKAHFGQRADYPLGNPFIRFRRDIYGRLAEVHFHQKLREERRFDTIQALIGQIGKDVETARTFFANVDPKILSA